MEKTNKIKNNPSALIVELVNYGIGLISKEEPNKNLSESLKKFAILTNRLQDEQYKICIKHFIVTLANKIPELSQINRDNKLELLAKPRNTIAEAMNDELLTKEKRDILIAVLTGFDNLNMQKRKPKNNKNI